MMLIRNVVATLTTFTILVASVSVVSATEHSSIRGSSASASASASTPDSSKNDDRRALIGLEEMVCEPTDDGVGSLVCTFRMIPPSTTDYLEQYNYCMRDGNGDEFCLKTEVFRKVTPRAPPLEIVSSYVETVPATAAASTEFLDEGTEGYVITTIEAAPVTPVETPPPAPSTAMNCPRFKPTSGGGCNGWLFEGSNYGSCPYGEGTTSCNCDNRAGHSEVKNIYWICDGDGFFPMAAEAAIDITANVNTIQESPTTPEEAEAAASTNTAGTINVPRPINDASCPIDTPSDGDACVELKRCGYLDRPVEATKLIDCRCASWGFHCQDADPALYGYYSGQSF